MAERHASASVTSFRAAALICLWLAIFYLPLYLGFNLSRLTHACEGEFVFRSIYQGIMMSSLVAFLPSIDAVVLLGPRAAAVIIPPAPVTATLLATPILGEWPSGAAICIISVGVSVAASSSYRANKKGESK